MKIGLCGNFNLEALAEHLDKRMPESVIVAGCAGAFREELARPLGDFQSLEFCIVALDWRTLAPELYAYAYGCDAGKIRVCIRNAIDDLKNAVDRYRTSSKAKLFVFTPVSDDSSPTGFLNRLSHPSAFELFASCQQLFNEFCRDSVDVYPVDLEEISSRIGKDNSFDAHGNCIDQQPFAALMTQTIADHLKAMCIQFFKYPLKCMVLDLDNTLWGGIVGEVGSEKIVLGDSGLGKAYKDFQSEIVKLQKQGVIIAICSKNNTCDALEVLEQHPHMLIRPNRISCFRINWEDKPENMIQISKELNIGLDSIIFIDENPSEREMMRVALPEVEILDLPEDPCCFADTLRRCSRFWPITITKDDADKGAFFIQERSRNRSKELARNLEKFLLDSHIEVAVEKADKDSLPRIQQLFAKTNQFNLTAKRYSLGELENLVKIDGNHLFCMRMKDIYGEYGTVSAALILNNTVDNFVLSCRAFGKQAERAFVVYLLTFLKAEGVATVRGQYLSSGRNNMTKDFYKEIGFVLEEEKDGKSIWEFDLKSELPESPKWISVQIPPARITDIKEGR